MLKDNINLSAIICFLIATVGGFFVFSMKEPQNGIIEFPIIKGDTLGIYHNPDGTLNWEQINHPDSHKYFVSATGGEKLPVLLNKKSSGAVSTWIRIPLENSSSESQHLCLEVGTKWIDLARLYMPQKNGSYTTLETGESIDYAERAIPARRPAFPITLEPNSQAVYYLFFEEENHSFAPIIKLWNSLEAFNQMLLTENRRVSFHFGLYFSIALFSVVAYLTIQSRDLLYYLIYVFLSGIIQINIFGLHSIIYPFTLIDGVWFSDVFFPAQALASGIFALFTLEFLETSKHSLRIDKTLRCFIWLYIFIMPAANLGMFGIPALMGFSSVFYGGIALTLVCFMVALAGIWKKRQQAYFYAIAYLIYTINQYRLFFDCITHIEPAGILTVQWLYGFSLEMIILTIALSERFLYIKNEKEQAQQKAYTEVKAFNKLQQDYTQSLQQEIKDQTAELQLASTRKDQLFRIVGDNLRVPFEKVADLSSKIKHIASIESLDAFRWKMQNIWLIGFNLLTHLENLLNWARLKVEGHPLNSRDYALADIVESILEKYQLLLQGNRITLHKAIDKNLFVHADLHHINIILRNLIAYAITDQKSQTHISISAFKRDSDVHIKIEHSKTGSGIVPEISNQSSNNDPQGHFAIRLCQQLVDLHGSQLRHRTTKENWGLFEFKLKAVEE